MGKLVFKLDTHGNLIGFAAYTNYKSNKHKLRKIAHKYLWKIILMSPLVRYKKNLWAYYDNYDYTPNELKYKIDSELTILILKKEYRGKDIGKQLINRVFKLAKRDNLKYMQILTDESCNYKFYNQIGCKLIYNCNVSNKEGKGERAFIYMKQL